MAKSHLRLSRSVVCDSPTLPTVLGMVPNVFDKMQPGRFFVPHRVVKRRFLKIPAGSATVSNEASVLMCRLVQHISFELVFLLNSDAIHVLPISWPTCGERPKIAAGYILNGACRGTIEPDSIIE
jgi:hypothetical protein